MDDKTKASLKFPRVDIVEASAGSGKTYTLAKRYVQLLMAFEPVAEEPPLKTILAVTFTNKATQEMKQRILEFLKKIALDAFTSNQEKDDIIASLAMSAMNAQKRAYHIMDDIISNYSFFQVQTIDSFINTLLSGCALHLGIASHLMVEQDYNRYLSYSLDRLIDKAADDKKVYKAFEDFLRYYLSVENKDSWFCKKDIEEMVGSLYSYSNIYAGLFKKSGINPTHLWEKKQKILKLIREIAENSPNTANSRFRGILESWIEKDKKTFDIDDLSDYFAREKFPLRKDEDPPKKITALWSRVRKDIKELCELEARAIFNPYIEIYTMLMDDFKKLADNDDTIFLPELNARAKALLGNESISIAEIYYRLATRLRHYLIDEFQDTSRLQWNNIYTMVFEALSSGGSLYYVGDKKQAIYRFRGGDVSIFDSVQEELKNYISERAILTRNYRSQKEIVEFNNRIFSKENLIRFISDSGIGNMTPSVSRDKDADIILKIFKDSQQQYQKDNQGGYVYIETYSGETQDERTDIVHQRLMPLIKELRERFPLSDIAVLTGENKEVELYTSWLIDKGIPAESEKTLNIKHHPLIKELISLLKFLDSPIDNLSFASFILGDIFLKASGLTRDTIQDFLFKLRVRAKKEKGIYLYREFRTKFQAVWEELIEEFFKNVGFVPLYELMISIFGKFNIMENFSEYQGFLMKLVEFIKENEEEYSGLASFIEFFESAQQQQDFYVNVTSADAIKVMTIHKAKGLEFGVVIVPSLEIDVNIGSGGPGYKKPYVVKQLDDGALSLIQLKKKYTVYSKELAQEYKNEYIKSLIDELNSIYVALTRPRHELYLFIPEKTGNKNNIAHLLIPYQTCEFGKKTDHKNTPRKQKEHPLLTLPVSEYTDWIGILKDEFTTESHLLYRDHVIQGKLLHLILSCIGDLSKEDRAAALAGAEEKARLQFPYVNNIDSHISAINGLLDNDKLKEFFYVKQGTVYNEKELIGHTGKLKRIDRLIIKQSEAWVIDYKSSKDETDTQREQVIEYMDIIKSAYPKKGIRGFLIFLDTKDVVEVDG